MADTRELCMTLRRDEPEGDDPAPWHLKATFDGKPLVDLRMWPGPVIDGGTDWLRSLLEGYWASRSILGGSPPLPPTPPATPSGPPVGSA